MNGINKETIFGGYIDAGNVTVGESYTIHNPQLEAITKELLEIKELLKQKTTTWIGKEDGIVTIRNSKGEETLSIDSEGNLHVKGKVTINSGSIKWN